MRIIDNKKVDLASDEYSMFQSICRSYDRTNFKGEDLFQDHFEVNNDGIIIFVKPPSKRYSSLEVYCFLISIMVNQHMRIMYAQNQALLVEARAEIMKLVEEVKSLKPSA